MAESVGTIYYTVEAETAKLISDLEAAKKRLEMLESGFNKTDASAKKVDMQLTKTAAAVRNLGNEGAGAERKIGGLIKMLGGFVAVQGVGGLIQLAEGYNEMAERIRMATNSTEEYEMAQARLLAGANRTYRGLEEAQEMFIRTAGSLRDMGYSTEQSLDVTDSLSLAFVKSATSADRAKIAMGAFSRSLSKGRVDSDAWEMLLISIPTLADDMSTALGMSAQEVRKLGAEGKLTTKALTEGLLGSLEQNGEAADKMATTIKDAFTSFRNSLTVFVGEANNSTGATKALSKAIVLLGENIDVVVTALTVAGAGALAKYIAQVGISVTSKGRAAVAARALATEELRLAQANAAATGAALSHIQANTELAASATAAARAHAAHSQALARLEAAKRAASAAGSGLIGVLGGPAGIIGLAAAAAVAIAAMGSDARGSATDIDKLTESIDKLTAAQLRNRMNEAADAADQYRKKLIDANIAVRGLARDVDALERDAAAGRGGIDAKGLSNARRELEAARADMDTQRQQLDRVIAAEKTLADAMNERSQAGSGVSDPTSQADPEVQKRLQAMRDEVELAKLTGAARARLQAIQRLGANATKGEREEAERLAVEIYRLEQAQKGAASAAKESVKASQDNEKAIADLGRQLYFAGLNGEALAIAQAKLALNDYATPEQIAQVEAMARALFNIQQIEQQRQKFGTGQQADQYIMGNVQPLSGGLFDDQYARYEAEAEAEQKRYDDQLERLKQARELKAETNKSYDQLEEEMAREHSKRMQQIEQAKAQALLSSGENLFGALADAAKNYAGESSGAYKAMFAASKAFAIANATLNLSTAISQAMADPTALTPAQKFANMAAIASAGGQLVSAISSASYGGGRQYGGPVAAGKMYRINETGAPEILNTNGKQYLMMNQSSGRVTPMESGGGRSGGAGAGGAPNFNINVEVNIASDGSAQTEIGGSNVPQGRQLAETVAALVQQGLMQEMGQGGLLWNQRNGYS